MQLGVAQFPNNVPLNKIYKQKVLDWMGLTPEETKEVMSFDDQNPNPAGGITTLAAPPGSPPGKPGPGVPPATPGPGAPTLPPSKLQLPSVLPPNLKLPQPVAA